MIGRLHGTLLEKQAPHLLIDVNGVGYEVAAPMTTFYKLPEVGEKTILHTHFVVREDAQLLYGFSDLADRSMFRELIKVNGVGPKLALTLLSGMDTHTFVNCVNESDVSSLVKLPGVGKKTAERLIVEMRDRLKDWSLVEGASTSDLSGEGAEVPTKSDQVSRSSAIKEAESALIALGFKGHEANKAVRAANAPGLTSEEIIKQALKGMIR
ncbi:MAG: Holliday junction branch migration protein RuvA [Pseudomonadales bacterium]|nr:Holliday junction branch migration protein RuvA [Pseudomonadales bacterium]